MRRVCIVERLANFIAHQSREADRITTLVDDSGFQDRTSGATQGVATGRTVCAALCADA